VRWASLADDEAGLVVAGDRPLHVRLDAYENLAEATRLPELRRAEATTLYVDATVAGVGGTAVKPLAQYRPRPEPVSFRLTLRPYDPAAADPGRVARRSPSATDTE
jgi:hypothetical protein